MNDPINPKHYRNHPSGVECISVTEHFNFNVGNAIKYLWRAGEKGKLLEDLKKANWYVQREIARVEKEHKTHDLGQTTPRLEPQGTPTNRKSRISKRRAR